MDKHQLLNEIAFQIFKYSEDNGMDIDEEQSYSIGSVALDVVEKTK